MIEEKKKTSSAASEKRPSARRGTCGRTAANGKTRMTDADAAFIAVGRDRLSKAALQAEQAANMDLRNDPGSDWARLFSTGESGGKIIYKSFSDEDLLDLLRERTRSLGHVPAQKEIFWVYRNYLRMRFEKWPYALKKAGLSTKAGKGGMTVEKMDERNQRYTELMAQVREKAKDLGRPPHMFEMEDIHKELKSWFTTWAEVLDAAGIDRSWQKKEVLYKVKKFSAEEKALLNELANLARRLGRAPLRGEVPEEMRRKLNRPCGTWRNTLYQIGLEPVSKITPFENTYLDRGKEQRKKHKDILENSLYKLVEPDDETKAMLWEVKAIANERKRPPLKSEIPSRTYSCLIHKCTTYRNVLYQIGLEPLERADAVRVQAAQRGRKGRDKR